MRDCLCFFHRYYKVRLNFQSQAVHTSFEVIIRGHSFAKIQTVILQSGFAPVDATIELIMNSDSKVPFVPILKLGEFCAELDDLKIGINRHREVLLLNTFDPMLWRQQEIERSRAKDLEIFRNKILSQIKGRYGLS